MKSDSDDKCTFIICCDLNANANDYVADHMCALPDDYEPDLPMCRSSHCYDESGITKATHYEKTPIQIYRKFQLQKLKIFR